MKDANLGLLDNSVLFDSYSYLIASAGRVLAARQAGYKLPKAPNSTASPNPSRTSCGVTVTVMEAVDAEPIDTPAVDTVLFPA